MNTSEMLFKLKVDHLMTLLSQIECTLDKQYEVLDTSQHQKATRMMDANTKRIAKAVQLRDELNFYTTVIDSTQSVFLNKNLSFRIQQIQLKILKNRSKANDMKEQSRQKLKAVRQGKSKVINGYFKHALPQSSYYIDQRIGK